MNSLVLIVITIGSVTATAYRSIPQQTDSSPYHTSTGEDVRKGGVAISRDLLCGACRKLHKRCKRPDNPTKVHYGDWLYVQDIGPLQVNDVMGAYTTQRVRGKLKRFPIKQHIDVWVKTYAEEKKFDQKYRGQPVELRKFEIEEKHNEAR